MFSVSRCCDALSYELAPLGREAKCSGTRGRMAAVEVMCGLKRPESSSQVQSFWRAHPFHPICFRHPGRLDQQGKCKRHWNKMGTEKEYGFM